MPNIDADEPILATLVEPTPEGSLVKRYVEERDEAAFAALVERFGALVFSQCRRLLQHEQDAEDAFQATFLVLARKAGSIGRRASVGSWLYRVAFRIARQIQVKKARLPVQESIPLEIPASEPTAEMVWRDLRLVIDEEVNRLPAKHRDPVVLCYFEGRSNEQAAAQLGCSLGTIASRLSRARERLRQRLKRRGIALSATLLAVILVGRASASAVPAALAQATARAALRFARGRLRNSTAAPPNSQSMAESFLRSHRRVWFARIAGGMFGSISALGALSLLIFALVPRSKPDQERIQGTWAATHIVMGGTSMPAAGSKMKFQNTQWTLDCKVGGPNDNFQASANFYLNPTQSPKAIDFYPERGVSWPGIYELDGDTLKVCFNCAGTARPTSFDSPLNSAIFLYHLKRE